MPFKFKTFQKQDLARAAQHDGIILSWDTGLWKTGASYIWPLLKVGFEQVPNTHDSRPDGLQPMVPVRGPKKLMPKKPVLLVVPGDLHQQTAQEAVDKFNIETIPITCQDDFLRLTSQSGSKQPRTNAAGIPIVPPGFYITSYTQLTINGVNRIPDPMDWPDPIALMDVFSIKHGDHRSAVNSMEQWGDRPDFESTCEFFAWRGIRWKDEFSRLGVSPQDSVKDLNRALDRAIECARQIRDFELRDDTIARHREAFEILKNLVCSRPDPKFIQLSPEQQLFIVRHFLSDKFARNAESIGEVREFAHLEDGSWQVINKDPSNKAPRPTTALKIECIYNPSIADLSYESFNVVSIDEGVKIKGEDTYVGLGVRKMNPKFRQVLTATPVKNRLPDIFRLAHWSAGGHAEATARWPYSDDSEERNRFAETFMVSERNLSKEAKAEAEGKPTGNRYKKLTAEVCNIHRLWKLFGPIVLRRRKDDCGEDIVPKIRKVIRCEMGTLQQKVYQYHLQASYLDKNEDPAVGAQLQALRMAAADPSSLHLVNKPGETSEPCRCTQKPVPPEVQLERLKKRRQDIAGQLTGLEPKALKEQQEELEKIDAEIAKPIPRFDSIPARKNCGACKGEGKLPLPVRSGQPYVPKMASVLTLIEEIIARGEQVVVGSAFNDPLDHLSGWLTEAGVRHVKLDGRVSQKKRGQHASVFKRGRNSSFKTHGNTVDVPDGIPVMLAGVECMAEGHSFHLANNVILMCYSWAYDKFIQFINRVHRMNSPFPVNVYVVVCTGTIDLRLESLIQDKGDAAELVLDGRLIGERTEEVNLADLLKIAWREFDAGSNTIDEALIHAQWPALREKLREAMHKWHPESTVPQPTNPQTHTNIPMTTPARRTNIKKIETPKPATAGIPPTQLTPATPPASGVPDWRAKLKARVAAMQSAPAVTSNAWKKL